MIPAESLPCPLCSAASDSLGAVDFHKSCLEERGLRLSPSGLDMYYRRCTRCGLVFCETSLAWSADDYKNAIYNADYIKVDPDYPESRPTASARAINQLFQDFKPFLSILDYGGGNGRCAERLREMGFEASTYDPFSEHAARPLYKSTLVTAFEVLEHSPNPHTLMRDVLSVLADDGLFLFTTRLQPPRFSDVGIGWWYIAPRNGHVSVYSSTALKVLCNGYGLEVRSITSDLHVAFRTLPLWAQHFVPA